MYNIVTVNSAFGVFESCYRVDSEHSHLKEKRSLLCVG